MLRDLAYRKILKMITLRYTEDNMGVTRAVKKMMLPSRGGEWESEMEVRRQSPRSMR